MLRNENASDVWFRCCIAFSLMLGVDCSARNEETDGITGAGTKPKDILFIVLSQVNEFHVRQTKEFKAHFEDQMSLLDRNQWPELLFTHEDLEHVSGAWTIFPLIEEIVSRHADSTWVMICEEETKLDIRRIVSKLQQFRDTEHIFLGRELRDREPSIIHHFAFADNASRFAYPDVRAGFVMSFALVKHLHLRLQTQRMKTDFSIDPKHEFALFVWDEGKGTSLTHIKEFCSADTSSDPYCITYQPGKFPVCGSPIGKNDVFVAVKTCSKFHETRVPVVKATWGKEAEIIEYFSEVANESIPTIDLGISNTERGHCGKTMAIIQRIHKTSDLSSIPWVLIADDDTIMNLDRLRALLACYDPSHPVALGERYGYGVVSGGGYDYITGGGGMVFSQPTIALLAKRCVCYGNDAPDDMTLGMCLKSLGVPVTHSRYFHQARPDDYSKEFLANQLPVSFHKHWNNDPYKVYAELTSSLVQAKDRTRKEQVHTHSAKNEEL